VSEVAGRRFGQVVGARTESGASTPRLDSIAVCPEKRQSSFGKNQAGGALRWPRNRKFVDSLLEGDGFELLVPRTKAVDFRSIPGFAGLSAGLLNETT
jgi:hypothetical protein